MERVVIDGGATYSGAMRTVKLGWCSGLFALLAVIACSTTEPRAPEKAADPQPAAAPQVVAAPQKPAAPASKAAEPAQTEEVGSLRNARVAFAMPDKKVELTYFAGEMGKEEIAEIAKLAPNVRIVSGLTREQALARAGEAHGIDSRFATAEFLGRATKLVWVQAMSAGVDRYLGLEALMKNDAIVLTNLRGVSGPAIADHAFAMLLELTRDLRVHNADQSEHRWSRESSSVRPIVLQGRTMFVVGIGGIGTEIAQRAHGFGMHVIATRRSDTPAPDYVEKLGKPEDLLPMLPKADVVAICVPLTPETEHLFNAAAFAAMKRGSYLINISRGKVVDTDSLVAALGSNQLAGACLDVTDPEPLPAEHALWTLPNVIITPHIASEAEVTDQRAWALLSENIRRFGAGEPLFNCVDKKAGY
jgi:phosphoglycerate dehydrogenase-like enzyme